jgi:hypothetical protein
VDEDGTTCHRRGAMAERLPGVDEDGMTVHAGPELASAQNLTAPTRRWPARKMTPSLFPFFSFFFFFSFFSF